jgi:hypothetical protein
MPRCVIVKDDAEWAAHQVPPFGTTTPAWLVTCSIIQFFVWICMLAYVPLQIVALIRFRKASRICALAVLGFMIVVVGWTAYAFYRDSNLAGIGLFCASPVAIEALLTLFGARLLDARVARVGSSSDG